VIPYRFLVPINKTIYIVAQSNMWWGFVEGSVTLYLQETFEQ